MDSLFFDGDDLGTVTPGIERLSTPPRLHFPAVAALVASLPTDEPQPTDEPIGFGLKQAQRVVSILENAGIKCCIVRATALCFYGAKRVFDEFEFCLPTSRLEEATRLLKGHIDGYTQVRPSYFALRVPDTIQYKYPRFKCNGNDVCFTLLSSQYCHISCESSNIQWSKNQLPFPTLGAFAQSLIDTNNGVDLEDLVDGMDLSLEWGHDHLDLEGSFDTEWAKWVNDTQLKDGEDPMFIFRSTEAKSRRSLWEEAVNNKKKRLGRKYSPTIYATRFRKHGAKDPTLNAGM